MINLFIINLMVSVLVLAVLLATASAKGKLCYKTQLMLACQCQDPIFVTSNHTLTLPTHSVNVGPIDYSNYLKHQYPQLAADPLTIMLKEQNAKALSHVHNSKVNIQNYIFKFTDKLMAHLSQRCACCQLNRCH